MNTMEERATWTRTETVAGRLFDLLAERPRTKRDLVAELGITDGQFKRALAWLKDFVQDLDGQPITCDPYTYEYHIPESALEAWQYVEHRGRVMHKQAQRLAMMVTAARVKFPDDVMLPMIEFQAKQMAALMKMYVETSKDAKVNAE